MRNPFATERIPARCEAISYTRASEGRPGSLKHCTFKPRHDGPHSYEVPNSPHYELADENEDDGLVDKYGEAAYDTDDDDPVHHPSHYTFIPATPKYPNGIEAIDVTRWFPFAEGNVLKYVIRAGRKGNRLEDLRKARQYLDFAIEFEEESNHDE